MMGSAATVVQPGQSQRSQLFASVLASPDAGTRLTVLDVGPALPETIDFFSRHRCHLVFADLFDDVGGRSLHSSSSIDWQQRFEQGLEIASGTRFDLCLFWELFNFLDDRALRAFSRALQPYLHASSRGYGLGLQQGTRRLSRQLYGITGADSFVVRTPPREFQQPCYAHPPSLLPQALPMFSVARAVLLSNGRLEYSLSACSRAG
jgi:hypothetical protein